MCHSRKFFNGLFLKHLYIVGWYYIITYKDLYKGLSFFCYLPSVLGILVVPLYTISQIICLFYQPFDLGRATENIAIWVSLIVSQIKILTVLLQIDDVAQLMSIFEYDCFQYDSIKDKVRGESIMDKCVKRTNRSILLFFCITHIAQIVWFSIPWLAGSSEQYHNTTSANKLLPGWYPWEYTQYPGYQIAFIYEVILSFFCSFSTIISSILFYQFTLMLCGHIDVLALSFANIKKVYMLENLPPNIEQLSSKPNYITSVPIKDDNTEDVKYLLTAIKNHQTLIRLAKKLNSVYRTFVAADVLFNLFLICLLLFQITSITEKRSIPDMLKSLTYLFGCSAMLFIVCWIGSELQSKSSKLSEHIYASDWYCSSKAFRKLLPTIMLMGQKELSLSAGCNFEANLLLFTQGMKFAYSFYTVLVNIYN